MNNSEINEKGSSLEEKNKETLINEFKKKIEEELEDIINYFLADKSIFNAPIYVRMIIQGNILNQSDKLKQLDYSSFMQESSLSIQDIHLIIDSTTVRMINGVTDKMLDCLTDERSKNILSDILKENFPQGSAPGMFHLKDLTKE